jgi:hypothetical protein
MEVQKIDDHGFKVVDEPSFHNLRNKTRALRKIYAYSRLHCIKEKSIHTLCRFYAIVQALHPPSHRRRRFPGISPGRVSLALYNVNAREQGQSERSQPALTIGQQKAASDRLQHMELTQNADPKKEDF